jgi:transposase
MRTSNEWIGIDVSKRFLDVEIAGQAPARLANCQEGHAALVDRLKRVAVAGVVIEATGGLERPVVAALLQAGLPASIVNPARVRAFAEGTGQLAKTDKIDAKVLASYGAYMRPAPAELPTATRAKLRELVAYRAQITGEITARAAQAKHYQTACLKQRAEAALAALRRERVALEREIKALVASDEALALRFKLLTSVPSVGTVVAATLIAELPELGSLSRRKIAALAGLAPFPRDSGDRKGYRAIRGGRAHVRCALFCAARVALQHNPNIKAFYERLRARGKNGKVAIVAAMHKLLTILNAMLKSNTIWQQLPAA